MERASWRAPVLFFLILAAVFFATNWAAYSGYFADDDFANMGWPTFVGNDVFIHGLCTPLYSGSHFRPVGFAFFRYAGRAFDLNFPPYVLLIQLIHLLNAVLVYLLLRRFEFSRAASYAGTAFYALYAVAMEVYWEPMFVFDLLCATFCLVTLLLYVRGWWIAGLATFWLAYKSKELAVTLPLALAACEFWIGKRRWWRLIPYLAISLSFGLQALWFNAHLDPTHGYALHFTARALWETVSFYASDIFFIPYAGFALVLLMLVRDRRVSIGLLMVASTFLPLLWLNNRAFAAYWYVPLIGLAIAAAAIAERVPRRALVAIAICLLPVNYLLVRAKGRELLALAEERRAYIAALQAYARTVPKLRAVVYEHVPEHMYSWGVEDGITKVFGWGITVVPAADPRAKQAMAQLPMAVISYDSVRREIRGTLRSTN